MVKYILMPEAAIQKIKKGDKFFCEWRIQSECCQNHNCGT